MAKLGQDARIALFIDYENLVTRTGLTAETFDLQPALDKLLEKGKVVYRRAYCDWGRFAAAKKNLHERGVELIDVPPSTRSGKNGADMRLVIDALELAYLREHVDTFVIASGDSDFCPLAYKLRENNRKVIGMAVREATSQLFVKACDEFIYIRTPVTRSPRERQPKPAARRPVETPRPVEPPPAVAPPEAEAPEPHSAADAPTPPAAPKRTRRPRRATAKAAPADVIPAEAAPPAPAPPAKAQSSEKKKPQAIPQVARDVVTSILARATGPVNPSLIKETIARQLPDFDVRDYGFSTFSRLLEALEREGMLRREKSERGQLYIVPAI
jgi:uncharacterized LabA/DUF88 family protein